MPNTLRRIFEMQGSGRSPAETRGDFLLQQNDSIAEALRTLRQLTLGMQKAREEGGQTYSQLGRAVQGWGRIAAQSMGQVLSLMTQERLAEETSVATHRRAEQAKGLVTLSSLKSTAFYRAIAATAAGFEALGEFDFWAATQDFASAALWGTLAGSQAASMARGGGSGPSRDRGPYGVPAANNGERSAGNSISELSSGAASAAMRPSGQLTISIMGDHEAGEWLAKTLSTAVEQRGVQLTASRTTRPAYAQG
ncbi:MAG TPA: hypothetical protein VFZ08_16560 [Terriglobia bacterium]|nr:hypothetical protein [Terriglobia bacterium]